MELGIREWLIIIGAVLLAFVLLDGIRRMRDERRNHIRVAFKMGGGVGASDSYVDPVDRVVGQVRVLGEKKASDSEAAIDSEDLQSSLPLGFASEDSATSATRSATQPASGQDQEGRTMQAPGTPEKIPMDSGTVRAPDHEQSERIEPSIGQLADFTGQAGQQRQFDPVSLNSVGREAVNSEDYTASEHSPSQAQNVEDFRAAAESRQEYGQQQYQQQADADQLDEEIVAVYVLSSNESGFNGADLLQVLLACDLRFGRGNIFHRHEYENGTGPVQFSMANLIEPGTFDLNTIESFQTPGVCFFMRMSGQQDPLQAFDMMVATANCIVSNLAGELRDEANSTMTQQTMEHYRHNVQEFERRQLTASV